MVEYSTDEEVGEALIDAAIKKGEYAAIETHKIKRIKKNVRLTLPPDPKATDHPETFIVWYQGHGMTAGLRATLRGNWMDRRRHRCLQGTICQEVWCHRGVQTALPRRGALGGR